MFFEQTLDQRQAVAKSSEPFGMQECLGQVRGCAQIPAARQELERFALNRWPVGLFGGNHGVPELLLRLRLGAAFEFPKGGIVGQVLAARLLG